MEWLKLINLFLQNESSCITDQIGIWKCCFCLGEGKTRVLVEVLLK